MYFKHVVPFLEYIIKYSVYQYISISLYLYSPARLIKTFFRAIFDPFFSSEQHFRTVANTVANFVTTEFLKSCSTRQSMLCY